MTELYPELRIDGPHSPDYTRDVTDTLAQAARVLAHATRGDGGLVNPADAYDLASRCQAAAASLEQAIRQTAGFLEQVSESERLRDDSGADPAQVAGQGSERFHSAADAAGSLSALLGRAQQTIAGLAMNNPEVTR